MSMFSNSKWVEMPAEVFLCPVLDRAEGILLNFSGVLF
jgi:hypothetical protein